MDASPKSGLLSLACCSPINKERSCWRWLLLRTSWEPDQFLAIQEIPHIFWDPKVHYQVYKSPPPGWSWLLILNILFGFVHIQKSGKYVQYIDPLNVSLKLQHVFLQHILLHFPADILAILFTRMLVVMTGASNKCFGLAEFNRKGTAGKRRSWQNGEKLLIASPHHWLIVLLESQY